MQTLPFDKWLVNVLERAGTETAGFFGWNSQSLLVPVVFLLGAWVHYKYRGWESMKDQLIPFLTLTLVPVTFLTLIIFAVNLVRAPYLLHREMDQRVRDASRTIDKLEGTNAALKTELSQAENKVADVEARLAEAPKKAPVKPHDPATSVPSVNQQGGQTAGTITNINPPDSEPEFRTNLVGTQAVLQDGQQLYRTDFTVEVVGKKSLSTLTVYVANTNIVAINAAPIGTRDIVGIFSGRVDEKFPSVVIRRPFGAHRVAVLSKSVAPPNLTFKYEF